MQHSITSSDGTLQVTVPGDILSTNAEQIRSEIFAILALDRVKTFNWTTLRIDLSGAKMVDSVGLNLIVALYKEASRRKAKTVAVISNPNIQRTFLFTRLDKHIEIVVV